MSAALTRRRLGNAMIAGATVLAMATTVPTADAISSEIRASDPSALSVAISRDVVPAGAAQGFLIAPDDNPSALAGVGAAIGAMAGPSSLLLTSPGVLDPAVAAEVDRIRNDATVAYVIDDAAVAAALEARGVTTNHVTGTPTEIAVALADQVYGVAAGTGQRLFVTRGDLVTAGLANATGANLAIPVVPVDGAWTGEAFLRQVIAVGDPAVLPDGDVSDQPGSPSVTRLWDADPDALGQALGAFQAADPLDGFMEGRIGQATILLDDDEVDPHPALLSAAVAGAYALDGFDATVRVLPRAASGPDTPSTRVGLTGQGAPSPTPPPLPATGGGLLLAGVLALVGGVVRRR